MLYGGYLWNIAVGSWTRKIDVSPLGGSLGEEYGVEGGSSDEILGGELECAEMGESVTEIFPPGDMSGGSGEGNIEVYILGENSLFGS